MTINYGIYIGTTAASIAKMVAGKPTILKSGTQEDSIPVCVAFNKRRSIFVGDAAYYAHSIDKHRTSAKSNNSFIGFTRTIGTDKLHYSSNLNQSFSSEELLAEVIKTLLSFEKDRNVKAAVMTIPAVYKQNQIDAVRQAGKMAGLIQIEFLQEPIAAGIAYGLNSKNKNGFWLVFDFGDDTFNSALLKVEEGIMKVTDTEEDNYLSGKDLDLAIVDEIIIPYLSENYNIEEILSNDSDKQVLRNTMKFYAVEAKNILSSKEKHNIYGDPGDAGEDNDGEEIEIDITLTQKDMGTVLSPVFQRAIDKCKTLLERNNLKGSDLNSLILVGKETYSPILRKMMEKQICKPNITVNPETAIVKGATLYASTVELSKEVKEQPRDKSKIQLEIGHGSSTVEAEEWVTIKILKDKTESEIPEKVFAEITRSDKVWSSGRVEINEIAETLETQLIEGKTNSFDVALYDGKGNLLESEPKQFTIIQGIEGLNKIQGLTLNWGIEKQDKRTGKITFCTIPGLEKNKSLPAVGRIKSLRTQKQIRPGMDSDFIKIPLYQGEHGADGTRTIYNKHVYDVIISGADLPALLPENSDVDLTIHIDKSQQVSIRAYIPHLDHTAEINVLTDTVQPIGTNWLTNEIRKAKGSVEELKNEGNTSAKLQKAETEIEELKKKFDKNKDDVDTKQEVLIQLRKILKTVNELSEANEWLKLEKELKEEFYRLEKANKELGNDKDIQVVNQLRSQLEEVIRVQDVKLGNALLDEINAILVQKSIEPSNHISFDFVENLLFKLTEESVIEASAFQTYFDLLYEMKNNPEQEVLLKIYKQLKQHEN